MTADLDEFSGSDLEEIVEVQQESLDELRDRVEALEARCEAQSRQLAVIRRTIAGGDEEFWALPRDGEGYNLVGRLEQYEATLDGFAERLSEIREPDR